jgi:mannose/fructose/N-acetylgalactosamine-specific phosphotransferase system component IIC
MNKKLFLRITILAIVVMVALVIFRSALDEVEMGPTLRFFDSAAGYILSIIGFGLIISLLLFGKEIPYPLFILALSLVVSGIIWGIILERAVFLIRKGSGKANDPAEPVAQADRKG